MLEALSWGVPPNVETQWWVPRSSASPAGPIQPGLLAALSARLDGREAVKDRRRGRPELSSLGEDRMSDGLAFTARNCVAVTAHETVEFVGGREHRARLHERAQVGTCDARSLCEDSRVC